MNFEFDMAASIVDFNFGHFLIESLKRFLLQWFFRFFVHRPYLGHLLSDESDESNEEEYEKLGS